MPETWKPVKLAAKVIGHISQGMYRTPAGAIKELISNAYDAGATYAKIHTGFPKFATFSCEDDGSGISKTKFIQLMEGGIGDSDKRAIAESQTGKNGRPVIGRLGVGLLSLAQICPRFHIRSFHGPTKTAFEAEIKFPPYSRQEIDKLIKDTKDQIAPIEHGEYKLLDLTYEEGRHGIVVTTSALRDTFRKTMSQLATYANLKLSKSTESYPSFTRYLESVANPKLSSLYFASPYDQLIFGLALASPLPYIEASGKTPSLETVLTKIPQLAKIQEELKGFDFRVELDNIQLRRPIVLPSNKDGTSVRDCIVPSSPKAVTFNLLDGTHKQVITVDRYDIKLKDKDEYYHLFYFSYSHKVNGYPLEFGGYIFLQTSRLFPKEFQGILIRLRNVAIGQYDVNVMTYPLAEGPRFSFLSSEVFVKTGLDDALKVDREGFNTLDPHYIRLQAFIHSILHELIFPGSWAEEKGRNQRKKAVLEKEIVSTFESKLRDTTGSRYSRIEVIPKLRGPVSTPPPARPVQLDRQSGTVRIHESHPSSKAILGRKKYHGLAARVIAAFEIANQGSSEAKRREVFYKLIEDIFE
jgi:hypothetical protein